MSFIAVRGTSNQMLSLSQCKPIRGNLYQNNSMRGNEFHDPATFVLASIYIPQALSKRSRKRQLLKRALKETYDRRLKGMFPPTIFGFRCLQAREQKSIHCVQRLQTDQTGPGRSLGIDPSSIRTWPVQNAHSGDEELGSFPWKPKRAEVPASAKLHFLQCICHPATNKVDR